MHCQHIQKLKTFTRIRTMHTPVTLLFLKYTTHVAPPSKPVITEKGRFLEALQSSSLWWVMSWVVKHLHSLQVTSQFRRAGMDSLQQKRQFRYKEILPEPLRDSGAIPPSHGRAFHCPDFQLLKGLETQYGSFGILSPNVFKLFTFESR